MGLEFQDECRILAGGLISRPKGVLLKDQIKMKGTIWMDPESYTEFVECTYNFSNFDHHIFDPKLSANKS